MRFMSNIIESKNSFLRDVDLIKNNQHPVVICGVMATSKRIHQFLKQCGIETYAIAVNQRYLKANETFCGFEVQSLETLITANRKFNYIIGFQQLNEQLKKDLQKNAALIVYYDTAFIGAEQDTISYDFCQQHATQLQWLNDNLEDELSRKTLIAFLNQRISAEPKYYSHVYQDDQYFAQSVVSLQSDEVFVDCGAFDGDTILALLKQMKTLDLKGPEAIYALEPDPDNFKLLAERTKNLPNCHLFKKGIWSQCETIIFSSGDGISSKIATDGDDLIKIDVDSIDNILNGKRASFIKMDIEGAELEALKGAAETIAKYHPKLAVSLYHRKEDTITIPQYIKTLNPDYKLYLRAHNKIFTTELVLYAVI